MNKIYILLLAVFGVAAAAAGIFSKSVHTIVLGIASAILAFSLYTYDYK